MPVGDLMDLSEITSCVDFFLAPTEGFFKLGDGNKPISFA